MQPNWSFCETVPAAFFNMSHYPYCKRRSTLSLSHHRYLLSTRNSELTCERQKKCKCRNEGKRRRCAPSLPRLRLSHIIRDDRKKGGHLQNSNESHQSCQPLLASFHHRKLGRVERKDDVHRRYSVLLNVLLKLSN